MDFFDRLLEFVGDDMTQKSQLLSQLSMVPEEKQQEFREVLALAYLAGYLRRAEIEK